MVKKTLINNPISKSRRFFNLQEAQLLSGLESPRAGRSPWEPASEMNWEPRAKYLASCNLVSFYYLLKILQNN